jgi:hypothetical protein
MSSHSLKSGRNTADQYSAGNSGRPKGTRNEVKLAIEIPVIAKQIGVAL